eukprot:5460459-Prymnesium_polylepis.1
MADKVRAALRRLWGGTARSRSRGGRVWRVWGGRRLCALPRVPPVAHGARSALSEGSGVPLKSRGS